MGKRVTFAVVVAAAGALLTPVANVRAAAQPALPWLAVAHPAGARPQLVDPRGRTVILRGVNVVGVEDDFYTTSAGVEPGPAPIWPIDPAAYEGTCPAMDHHAGEAPVCEVQAGQGEYQQSTTTDSHNDFAQMRALGFNFARLGLSWSQLEPRPGRYNQTYLDRIAQVVGWAGQQGIYVLLDMHQDNYSRFTPETAPISAPPLIGPTQESSAHADGAPRWAVMDDGVPADAIAGLGQFNASVEAAFTSFWLNRIPPAAAQGVAPGPGLQDHYIGALSALARRFKGDSTVVGYEIMNEPLPGFIPPVAFTTAALFPFYAKVVNALTAPGVGVSRQSFFFEPMGIRNLDDAPDQLPLPFATYPNLVYAPHTYTHVFTFETRIPGPVKLPYPLSYDQAYQVADAEARSLGAALLPTEFGNSASQDNTILARETAAQDRAMAGSAIYAWKGVCRAGAPLRECFDAWSVYAGDPATPPAQNLGLIPTRVKYLSRVYPRATAGTLTSFAYHPGSGTFVMTATADRPWSAPTELFIPAGVNGNVTVTGAASLASVTVEPDGTRLASIMPTGRGAYIVTVS